MTEQSIAEPRTPAETQQADWNWICDVLIMVRDRARAGTPVHLRRPQGWPPNADIADTMRYSMYRQIDSILSTAVIIEPEAPDAAE